MDSQSSAKSVEVIKIAKSLIGKDYKYGATGPNSFGSAGLATYIFNQVGIKVDDTIVKLYKAGEAVTEANKQEGDLLFFSSTGQGDRASWGSTSEMTNIFIRPKAETL